VGLDLGGVNGRCRSHEDNLQTAGRFAHARGVAEGVPRTGESVAWGTLMLIAQEAAHGPAPMARTRDLPGQRAPNRHDHAAEPCVPAPVAAQVNLGFATSRTGVIRATLAGSRGDGAASIMGEHGEPGIPALASELAVTRSQR
jgi:hypothetical protein